jgi:hypothetical protein
MTVATAPRRFLAAPRTNADKGVQCHVCGAPPTSSFAGLDDLIQNVSVGQGAKDR